MSKVFYKLFRQRNSKCPACGYWAYNGHECLDCGYSRQR